MSTKPNGRFARVAACKKPRAKRHTKHVRNASVAKQTQESQHKSKGKLMNLTGRVARVPATRQAKQQQQYTAPTSYIGMCSAVCFAWRRVRARPDPPSNTTATHTTYIVCGGVWFCLCCLAGRVANQNNNARPLHRQHAQSRKTL